MRLRGASGVVARTGCSACVVYSQCQPALARTTQHGCDDERRQGSSGPSKWPSTPVDLTRASERAGSAAASS